MTINSLNMDSSSETCRVVVLGQGQSRLIKVMSILKDSECALYHKNVNIEYLPCVPVFNSYKDERGSSVRYLSRVDHLGPDASLTIPGTLLPFLDDHRDVDSNRGGIAKEPLFRGISGLVAGSGIENDEDVEKVVRFLETISGATIPAETIQPNAPFSSMEEELLFFKSLTNDEREEASRLGNVGPGKMAKFVEGFAKKLIDRSVPGRCATTTDSAISPHEEECSTDPRLSSLSSRDASPLCIVDDLDPAKNRYCCRKCRTTLFREDDLQNPPHFPSQHKFSHRKHNAQSSTSAVCQSLFLQNGISWMGNMVEMEGRLNCPKCEAKVGNWNWSGAQCSCGTWVVPAIQIPSSRVDVIEPRERDLSGFITKPFSAED